MGRMIALLLLCTVGAVSPAAATTVYTPESQFRDAGNTWAGMWGQNRDAACRSKGHRTTYKKELFKSPIREICTNGTNILRIDSYAYTRPQKPNPLGFCGPSTFSCGVGSNYMCCSLGESCVQPKPGQYMCAK